MRCNRRVSSPFGAWNLLCLAAIAVAVAGAIVLPPHWSDAEKRNVARALGVVLLGAELSWWVYDALSGEWRQVGGLPLQLCDIAAVVGAVALWTRHQLLIEITWFWAVGGAVQALLTPELPAPFPSWLAFQYYLAHGSAVAAAALLVIGLRHYPRPWSVARMILLTGLVAIAIGIIDFTTGANYLFLRAAPPIASMLSLLGTWPRYPLLVGLLGVAFLVLLDLPFFVRRRLRSPARGANREARSTP